MSNNHAKLATSERLQAVKAVLDDGGWHTTRDIMLGANTVSPAACVAELRSNGLTVLSQCTRQPNGRSLWQYRLVSKKEMAAVKEERQKETKTDALPTSNPSGQMDFLRTNIGGMAVVKCP